MLKIDPYRLFLIFFVHIIFIIILSIVVIKVLLRNPKNRLNQVFTMFYIITFLGMSVNMFYLLISDPSLEFLATFLNIFTIFIACLSTGILLLVITLLHNPKKFIETKNQVKIIIFYMCLLMVFFLIPNGARVQILQDGTQLSPVWSLPFTVYVLCILFITLFLCIWKSINICKNIKNEILLKRFKYFVIGMLFLFYLPIGASFSNYLNIPLIRQLYSISALIIIPGLIFIYHGIGRGLQDNKFKLK